MNRLLNIVAALIALAFAPAAFAQGVCPANSFGQASAPITTLPYTLGQGDFCLTKVFNSSGSGVVTLPAPGTAGGFFPNFNVQLFNYGAGTLTLTPATPFSGAAPTINGAATIALAKGQGATLAIGTDGNWYANTNSASTGGINTVANGGTGLATLTAHAVMLGEGTSNVGFAGPGATSGVPLIAQGTGADPVFGTAVVAGGGTGQTTLTIHGVLVGEAQTAINAIAAGTSGQVLYGAGASADPAFGTPVNIALNPGNLSAVTPGTGNVMMLGLAGGITPAVSGRISFTIAGTVTISSTANGARITCRYGTGTAPSNAGAAAGTVVGYTDGVAILEGASGAKTPFTCGGTVSGLTLATAYWLDVGVINSGGPQAVTVSNVSIFGNEF